jgi:hypothetical protein
MEGRPFVPITVLKAMLSTIALRQPTNRRPSIRPHHRIEGHSFPEPFAVRSVIDNALKIQASTQCPQLTQFSGCMIMTCKPLSPFTISRTLCRHSFTHIPHLTHLSSSILIVFPFSKECLKNPIMIKFVNI